MKGRFWRKTFAAAMALLIFSTALSAILSVTDTMPTTLSRVLSDADV